MYNIILELYNLEASKLCTRKKYFSGATNDISIAQSTNLRCTDISTWITYPCL